MKLRIKENSIRLRLTQTEVDEIGKGNAVSESVSFGAQSPAFHYTLSPATALDVITAKFTDHTLHVSLPSSQAKEWADTDQVGMERDIPIGDGQSLYVLVEKDFKCLHQRPREDERDNFPNPEADKV